MTHDFTTTYNIERDSNLFASDINDIPDFSFDFTDLAEGHSITPLENIPSMLAEVQVYTQKHQNQISDEPQWTTDLNAADVPGVDHPVHHRGDATSQTDNINPASTSALPHACQECGRAFKQPKDLKRHQDTVHRKEAPNGEIWVCDEAGCARRGKPFSRKDNYLKHIRAHKKMKDKRERSSSSTAVDGLGKSAGRRGELEELSREELVELLIQERQKYRRLEEDVRAERNRQDMWLKVTLGRTGGK
ncbi:hypothetical protein B0T14DRAFT_259507 [Immersiella caudata]|uniref:pH-response transcription factor pacC/RIM101 n=1 Tax=Immersiella caudata TaxID=314043 RepID=A0AA39WKM1_9PEZI|nr:hypothetical protein B0T14DRAFT_259507 [Immersiella caudata]